jgi:thymidylate kinase
VAVPRLILIEGMIGSGKTTTAQYLADWLSRRGEDVRAFDEGAADHPIRTRRVDELLGAPASGDPSVYAAGQWRRLAERCLRDEQTIICESVFLQNSVMPAFIDGAPVATVAEICAEIEWQAAPAEPFLVYLRPDDIPAAIARVHQARGEPWSSRNLAFVQDSPWARRRGLRGRDAVVGLYQAWEPAAVELFDRYPFGKLMLPDPQHDWPAALRSMRHAIRPDRIGVHP